MTDNLFIKKNQIIQMPNDFKRVIGDFDQNEPEKIRVSRTGKLKRIEINIENSIQLIVYESETKGTVKAYYIAFDNDSGTFYKKDLVC
jgi:hypothetical protein